MNLQEAQLEMAQFLRDPEGRNPPQGVEARRLQVYRDLVYNNIAGFINSAFPVLHSLYEEEAWAALIREFILKHRCSTPIFLEISQEFLSFLSARTPPALRPFEAELAHYEWLELAVDVAEGEPAEVYAGAAPQGCIASLALTAQVGAYQYPVHRIGPSFQPPEPVPGGSFLMVYRDRENRVQFMELSAGSARLLHELVLTADDSLSEKSPETVQDLLVRLAREWSMEAQTLLDFGLTQLLEFNRLGAVALRELAKA